MGNTFNWLEEARKKYGVLIAAHRGVCGGNVIQNTTLAYEAALQHGAHMVEIDAIMSTDGDFFAFHNGQEPLVLGIKEDIRKMSTAQIEALDCFNQLGEKVNQKLERLEDVLERLKGRALINIDRSWFYWRETIEFINKQNMESQILLKSAPDDDLLATLETYGPNIMYMPIVKEMADWQKAKLHKINLVAAELIFETLESPLVQREFIDLLHSEGIVLWVNAITLNDSTVLSAHLDDNNAISSSYEKNWGKLIEMGFDIVQTDWPALVKKFIIDKERGK